MRKILIIDSDPEFRRMLADFLEAKKFQVFQALSGNEGLRVQEAERPDLVLISRELLQPDGRVGADGLRILKTIKLDKRFRKLPVILMSNDATEDDFERYRRLRFSADDYVRKPFEDTDLMRRVENLIGFDIAEDAQRVKTAVDDVMDESIGNIFDADKEELGLSTSAATRRELSELMQQVGAEMDRHEQALKWERPPARDEEVESLRAELEQARQRLAEESERSGELKERWKKAFLVIDSRLKKSQEREERFRDELENMRRRFADIELDHTMELERLQAEKRRAQEELESLRGRMRESNPLLPELTENLQRALDILKSLLEKIERGH
jgi:DNA-binding response OmpR family regulator